MKKRLLARIHPILLQLVLLPFMFIWTTTLAQNRVITGKVTDTKDGSPLAGVSVIPKGSDKGTVTGADGAFLISVPPKVTALVFSFIGFGTQQVAITGDNLTVGLTATNAALNEVVVIGYGKVNKKDLTGSIATLTEKDFQKGNITTPEQLISGKIAGVSVISNSGQPGAGSTIRIRGGSSLNASNDPLIVIDGVPMDNEVPARQTSALAGASSPLSFINPNDIESFTVLRDASASAIYGTRASNGVILITTRKGRGGALKVNLSSVNSVSAITRQVPVLNAAQFKSVVNANGTAAQIAMLGTANTNWQDQIYRAGIGTDNNVSVSGGLKNIPYRFSIGFMDQDGILRTDNLQRTSGSLSLNPVLLDNHLKIDINVKGSMENTRFGNTTAIGGATSFDPTQPVYVKNTRFGGYYEWLDPTVPTGLRNLVGRNPLGLLNETFNTSTPKRSIGNIQIDYKFHFLPDLHLHVNAGYDKATGQGRSFVTDSASSSYIAGGTGGTDNPYKQTKNNSLFEFYLNYTKDLKSIKSHIDIVAGHSYNKYVTTIYNYPTYYANGKKVVNSDPPNLFDKPAHTLVSWFGRLNYTFDDRYLLTATLRDDASSRFGPTNRHALFPSVALAWKIKDEAFLRNSNAVSDLKLRLSYGITGQQDGLPNYAYKAVYDLSASNASYQFGNSYYQGYRPEAYNPSLKWEQTATSNIGLDYGFLDNRISGSLDVYEKKTSDLLNNAPQPAGSNFIPFFIVNAGSMTNRGVEFTINTEPIRSRDLTWDVGFNITYNENTITKLTVLPNDTSYLGFPSGDIAGGIGGHFAFLNAVGSPKNTFYLYQQVYDKTGKPIEGIFTDKNGDGIINQQDQFKGKSADPKVFLGFSTNLNYKNWSGGFVLRGSFGNYDYNNIYSQTGSLTQILGNAVLYNGSTNYLTTGFKGGNGQQLLSDYYIQDASFLRMDNINIGYNLGQLVHRKATLRISAYVQNVFVITKYSGLDPEIAANAQTSGNPGIDNNLYPRPRTYALGINLGF